jgi:hypothetical protein
MRVEGAGERTTIGEDVLTEEDPRAPSISAFGCDPGDEKLTQGKRAGKGAFLSRDNHPKAVLRTDGLANIHPDAGEEERSCAKPR